MIFYMSVFRGIFSKKRFCMFSFLIASTLLFDSSNHHTLRDFYNGVNILLLSLYCDHYVLCSVLIFGIKFMFYDKEQIFSYYVYLAVPWYLLGCPFLHQTGSSFPFKIFISLNLTCLVDIVCDGYTGGRSSIPTHGDTLGLGK